MAAQGLAQLGDSDDKHKVEEQFKRRGATLLVGIVDGPEVRRPPERRCPSRTSLCRCTSRRKVRIFGAVAGSLSHGFVHISGPLALAASRDRSERGVLE